MKENITVRKVRSDDIEKIARIAVIAWEPIYAAYMEDIGKDLFDIMHSGWREEKARQVRAKAERQPEQVYVSEINDRIIGFTSFNIDEDRKVGEIGNNAVLPIFGNYSKSLAL